MTPTMIDADRLYGALERLQDKMERNHTDIIQRLTRLESATHTPVDCDGLRGHIEDHKEAEKANGVRKLIDYAIKGLVAAGLLYGGSKFGG